MGAHVKGKKRNESGREAAAVSPRRLPGGKDVCCLPSPAFASCSPWQRAAPSAPAEVLPLDHAGAKPAETSVQQG